MSAFQCSTLPFFLSSLLHLLLAAFSGKHLQQALLVIRFQPLTRGRWAGQQSQRMEEVGFRLQAAVEEAGAAIGTIFLASLRAGSLEARDH